MDGGKDQVYQVAIVGGGIHGCSAAHRLSAAGYSVVLLEKGDFASGTTSRSTRNLNCGLVFLNPDLSLWDHLARPGRSWATIEAIKLYQKARHDLIGRFPERLRPYRALLPIYRGQGPAPWMLRAALALIEKLGHRDAPIEVERIAPSRWDSHPLICHVGRRSDLEAVFAITEYVYEWPERIALDHVVAARSAGAAMENYTAVTSLSHDGQDWCLDLSGRRSGSVRAKVLLNTAGPWVDRVNRLGGAGARPCVEGDRGAHIAVALPEATQGFALYARLPDKGPRFLIPWRDFHHFGSGHSLERDNPEDESIDEAEMQALFQDLQSLLPGAGLGQDAVLYGWAGVRPASAARGQVGSPGHSGFPRYWDLSEEGLPNAMAVTGASISSQAATAERLLSFVSERIGQVQRVASRPETAQAEPGPSQPIANREGAIDSARLRALAEGEQVVHLSDLLIRRAGLAYDRGLGLELAQQAALAVAPSLDWDDARVTQEVKAYGAEIRRLYRPRVS